MKIENIEDESFKDEFAKKEYFISEFIKKIRVIVIILVITFFKSIFNSTFLNYGGMSNKLDFYDVIQNGFFTAAVIGGPISLLWLLFGGRKYGIRFWFRIIFYILFAFVAYYFINEVVRFSVTFKCQRVDQKIKEENEYNVIVQKYRNVEEDYETGSYFRTRPNEDAYGESNPVPIDLSTIRKYDEESGCICTMDKDKEGNWFCKVVASYYTEGDILNIPSKFPAIDIHEEDLDRYEKYPVKYIGKNAFTETIKYKKIIVPDTVLGICAGAFKGCTNLTEIVIGDNVRVIKDNAFVDMPDLTIVCNKDSAAYKYAVDNNIKVKLMGED